MQACAHPKDHRVVSGVAIYCGLCKKMVGVLPKTQSKKVLTNAMLDKMVREGLDIQ